MSEMSEAIALKNVVELIASFCACENVLGRLNMIVYKTVEFELII